VRNTNKGIVSASFEHQQGLKHRYDWCFERNLFCGGKNRKGNSEKEVCEGIGPLLRQAQYRLGSG